MTESHKRFIAVPKNEDGSEEYCHGVRKSDNVIFTHLPEPELIYMYESGFLDFINDEYDQMLGDFESGYINGDLDYLLYESEQIKDKCPVLYKSVKQAIEYGAGIGFEL